MIGLAAWEMVYAEKFYSAQYELLENVTAEFDKAPDNLDRQETAAAVDRAYEHWTKGKKRIMIITNHNIVKQVDEKFVSLREMARQNQKADAYVTLGVTKTFIKDLKADCYPTIQNLL